ncbi:hypothetical protein LSCM1_07657 [Leishmania martiniquensis]|uniref:Uncharacterized protein n=1 Tax=Leishmania martiniquensis TaxID=1580590 RepID=A0A836HQB3_9TRYP|nr:hypothetical protein LSCM1_07657 [Leishmania martiniquensis]
MPASASLGASICTRMSVTDSRHPPPCSPDTIEHTNALDMALPERRAPANPLLATPSSHVSPAGGLCVAPCAATGTSSAEPAPDLVALLRHALVRDLIRENEGMLMELAGLRASARRRCATQLHLVALEESAARAALKASESIERGVLAARAHASLAARVQRLEQQLCDEALEAAELRGFAELAQAQLATSPRLHTQGVTPERKQYASSPARVRRGSNVADVDGDSQRTSLEEITNARGPVKRLRSVESSDSGSTPLDQARRTSSSQKSPGALTKMRKTIH